MLDFEIFYNNWLDCSDFVSGKGIDHKVNLSKDFFTDLRFDSESCKKYRIDAALRCAKTLGNKPALCFSGGIDSQAMIQCFVEAKCDFDIIICKFNDGLNTQDTDHAEWFCKTKNYQYKIIMFDVVKFLIRDNMPIGEKYKSVSPQFNVHYKLSEILAEQGYTGVVFGGTVPMRVDDTYGSNVISAPFYFTKNIDKFAIPFQGSFLSYSPELVWAITLQCDPFIGENPNHFLYTAVEKENTTRYMQKIYSYWKTGLDVVPQSRKYTGFEKVKIYFEKLTNDGWAFEKRFRYPLMDLHYKDAHPYKFEFKENVLSEILLIHDQRLSSCNSSPANIAV